MRVAQDMLLAKVRPFLIPLVESFHFFELPSNIGNYHGDIYELNFEQARSSGMQ